MDPIKVTISNFPEGQIELLRAKNNPEDESKGFREIPYTREIYIDREDFMEDPPKKYFRLSPGNVVRLKYAFIIRCLEVIKNPQGEIEELICEYYPESRSGQDTSGIKVKGTIHWVSKNHASEIEVRNYDRLFTLENPDQGEENDYLTYLNPDALKISKGLADQGIKNATSGDRFQFERKGYYCMDPDSTVDKKVFNLTVPLRDRWSKIAVKK